MEHFDGEVYIDNAEDMDLTVHQLPLQWTMHRDYFQEAAIMKNVSSHEWIYSETDVIILRECLELAGAEAKLWQQPGQRDEGVLECSWCEDIFLSPAHLTRHWLTAHLAWDTRCDACLLPLTQSLGRHECEASYPCHICHNLFSSKLKLMRHYFNNHSTFYCLLSEKVFTKLQDFRKHIEAQNEDLDRSCILCKATLKPNNLSLKKHLLEKC